MWWIYIYSISIFITMPAGGFFVACTLFPIVQAFKKEGTDFQMMCSATTNTQTYMLYAIIYDFDREKLSKCCISSLSQTRFLKVKIIITQS